MRVLQLLMILFFLIGCTQANDCEYLKRDIEQLKKENANLKIQVDSFNERYILPFNIYEENVLNEFKRSPDTIIKIYQELIKKYPNSLWKHESEQRIKNIESKRNYWSKSKGWDFKQNIIPPKPNYGESVISCPGC